MTVTSLQFGRQGPTKTASTFLFVEGGVLAALGVAAMAYPVLAGVATAVLLGWILTASGIAGLVGAFTSKPHVHFRWSLISSILAIAAGLTLATRPFAGATVFIIVIAAWLALDGVSTLMIARDLHGSGRKLWGWLVASAIVDWLFALMMLFLSPVGDIVAVGVIVGIDLILGGVALLTIGLALRRSAA
jgi:membrane protein HdeD